MVFLWFSYGFPINFHEIPAKTTRKSHEIQLGSWRSRSEQQDDTQHCLVGPHLGWHDHQIIINIMYTFMYH